MDFKSEKDGPLISPRRGKINLSEELNYSEQTSAERSIESPYDSEDQKIQQIIMSDYVKQFEVQLTCVDHICVLGLGIGCIILVNAVFTDLDFFVEYLPNRNVVFLIPLILNVPQVIGQLIAIKYLASLPVKETVLTITLFAAIVSLSLPGIMLSDLKFILTMLAITYFGLFLAVINSAIIGYVSSIPSKKSMSTYMVGCSVNAWIIIIVQVICILTLPNKIWVSSMIYFSATALILCFSCVCFLHLTRKFQIKQNSHVEWHQIKEVYQEIWPEALAISLTYGVSLTVYPGLFFYLSYWKIQSQWLSVFVVGVYNICDCFGRIIPSYFEGPSNITLRWLAAARLLLVVLVIIALPSVGINYLQSSSWYAVLLLCFVGISQGYVGTFIMIRGCSGTKQAEVGGYVMAFHLTIGLAVGSAFATLLSTIFI